MKKVLAILLTTSMLFCMVACGTTKPLPPQDTSSDSVKEQAPETSTPNPAEKTVFERFEAILQDRNITYETSQTFAEMIGAEQGIKYHIGDGRIELYLFDESSSAYKTALETQKLTIEGFGNFEAHVASGVAMQIDGLDESVYLEIFKEITK